jgi:hypothetical protein
MNSSCDPSSWRGLLLGAQASLPAAFRRELAERSKQAKNPALPGKRFLRLIVTAFPPSASPTLFAQTNDNAATAGDGNPSLIAQPPQASGRRAPVLGEQCAHRPSRQFAREFLWRLDQCASAESTASLKPNAPNRSFRITPNYL